MSEVSERIFDYMHLKDIIELLDGTPLIPDVDMNIKIRGGVEQIS
jgi:hypothetical protein